ncbi:hypothetical protein [Haloarchaeobius litoreus]|uniref:Uncharacterized protein n=1 Tax=Haloarchaeobius litoreus TaxID=755306 RepID=A0ABD6DNL3_9EURY|nr:hypothetical protein [Haloarchaeobius litoreus]
MASLADQFRAAPVLVSLSLGSLLACVGLFFGTMALLALGYTDGTRPLWLAVVVVGVAVTVLWNVCYPLYDAFAA